MRYARARVFICLAAVCDAWSTHARSRCCCPSLLRSGRWLHTHSLVCRSYAGRRSMPGRRRPRRCFCCSSSSRPSAPSSSASPRPQARLGDRSHRPARLQPGRPTAGARSPWRRCTPRLAPVPRTHRCASLRVSMPCCVSSCVYSMCDRLAQRPPRCARRSSLLHPVQLESAQFFPAQGARELPPENYPPHERTTPLRRELPG